MSVCGMCARAGDAVGSHCGWCTCCMTNRAGTGGQSPTAGGQKRSICGLLFVAALVAAVLALAMICG